MTPNADVCPKIQTLKDVVKHMSKKSRLRETFHTQHVKQAQTIFKSEPQNL